MKENYESEHLEKYNSFPFAKNEKCANWVFTAPTLTNETYSEPIIHDESPDTVLNFSGKLLSEVQEWASS